jgi:hypothetical protein
LEDNIEVGCKAVQFWREPDVSKEHIASTFKVKEEAKKEKKGISRQGHNHHRDTANQI